MSQEFFKALENMRKDSVSENQAFEGPVNTIYADIAELAARMGVEAKATTPDPQSWNGEGLPPVGCVCEIPDYLGDWIEVKCIGFDECDNAPVFLVNATWVKYKSSKLFRPILTEREKAIDVMVQITESCESKKDAYIELYDLGWRPPTT